MIIEDIQLKKMRQRHKLSDMVQDMKLLAEGVLDMRSLVNGYQKVTDPVMVEVHDANGRLKTRRYTHNLRTTVGTGWQAAAMGNGKAAFTAAYTAVSTAAPWTVTVASTANAYLGQIAVIGGVYGVITANSGTVITVDQWYNPATQAVGTTPAATGTVTIPPGAAPAWYLALSSTSTLAPAVADTTLAGEITTPTSMARTQGTYASPASGGAANTYQLQHQFNNNNAAGGASVSAYGAGCFLGASNSIMAFENTFTGATLAPGDQLTLTWSWTI